LPSGPGWRQIGAFTLDAFIVGVVGIATGYVVALEDRNGAAIWFSADGHEWRAGSLAQQVPGCSGALTPDSYGSGASGDGQRAAVFGGLLAFTPQNCASPDLGFSGGGVVWLTSDGATWVRSSPFAQRESIIDDVWPMPGGGWEASVSSFERPTAVWQSTDGLSWNQVATFAGQVGESSRADVAADGTRLLAGRLPTGETALFSSSDGVAWDPLPAQPTFGDDESVIEVIAPATGGDWLVVTIDPAGSGLWVSADLGAWQRRAFTGDRIVTNIIGRGAGYIASAERADLYFQACDADCPGPAERQYVTAQGQVWSEVTPRLRAGAYLATGPAGTIAVGRFDGKVWLLEP
jgi:hypothetical protein